MIVTLVGYYGFKNAGDEAVLSGIIKALREASGKQGKKIEFLVLTGDCEDTFSRHKATPVKRMCIIGIVKAVLKSDALILGGGSLLQDVTGRGLTVIYYASIAFLAKLLGRKVIFYAQGVGPLKRTLNKLLTKWAAKVSDIVSVRDEGSRLFLRDLGVDDKKIVLTSDPAFAIEPDCSSASVSKALPKLPEGKLLGVMLRDWDGIDAVLPQIADAIKEIALRHSLSVALLPMQKPYDKVAAQKLLPMLNGVEAVLVDGEFESGELVALFGRFEIVVAMRLHALIFAAIAGVPMLGLGYDPKVSAFLSRLDTGEALEMKGLDSVLLKIKLHSLFENRAETGKELKYKAQKLKSEAFSFAEDVFDFLYNKEKR